MIAIADTGSTTNLPATIVFCAVVLFLAGAVHLFQSRRARLAKARTPRSAAPQLPSCSGDANRCPGVGSIVVLAPGAVGLTIRRVCNTHYLDGLIRGYWPGRTNIPFDQTTADLAAEAEAYLRDRANGRLS